MYTRIPRANIVSGCSTDHDLVVFIDTKHKATGYKGRIKILLAHLETSNFLFVYRIFSRFVSFRGNTKGLLVMYKRKGDIKGD